MSVLLQDTATTEASSSTKSRVMERNLQKLVDEIKDELGSCVKSYKLPDFAGSFVPDLDMQRIWIDDRIRFLFAVARPPLGGNGLGGFQLTHLRSKALPLLSFAASIRRSLDWFLETFPRLVFTSNGWLRTETDIQFPLSSSDLNTLLGEKLSTEDFNLHLHFAPRVTLKLGAHAESVLEVQTRDALPLETQSGRAPREVGSYGTVYLCRIIPEYAEVYSDHDSEVSRPLKSRPVAVKVFHEKELAKRELENLKLLKRIASNPLGQHRITLHHTIVQHTEGRETEDLPTPLIIFPFADLGNLLQFLDSSSALGDVNGLFRSRTFDERFPHFPPLPTPPHDTARFRRASELLLPQCIALAKALRFLHSNIEESGQVYLVAHMDIKPDNILISSRQGHHVGWWKLADFGISAIHSRSLVHALDATGNGFEGYDWNRTIGTLARRGLGTHQAPEIERSWMSRRLPKEQWVHVGRKGDIWSFGVILAEVLAFAEGGKNGVKNFELMRKSTNLIGDQGFSNDDFWDPMPPGSPRLRPAVGQWLEQVKGRCPASAPWVECIEDTLVVDPHARPSAEQLAQYVNRVLFTPPPANPSHQSPAQPAVPVSPPSEQALNSSQGLPNTPQPSYPPQSRNPSVRAEPEPQPQPRPAQHSDRSETSSIAASSSSAPRSFGDRVLSAILQNVGRAGHH
ncbi:serine/threonine protein kinase [Gaeumannomyces tritici R3-111a-1]|uniref:non-specific serine/threonine protein kinase n=1 Tax=Gaeumannomyces tritici (strain R3-111a-1) TaxID=644352 RepID=J3NLY8_GAET3|nr:serine/threonine protein kinase [Gaeumannomyces tritici R3-111a-1]EJT82319.1 serine/threonine protein kinase [Gaeumannomyces tritici R3-111a-1]